MTDAQRYRHQHLHISIHFDRCQRAMRLLGLGIRLVAGYSFFSLLLSFVVVHRAFDERIDLPSWAADAPLGTMSVASGGHTPPNRPSKTDVTIPVSTRFFPTYGTKEFFEKCAWTAATRQLNANCTFLVRPFPETNEGISHWIPQIVAGHFLAQQTGCNLNFDYGPDINVHQVLMPFPAVGKFQAMNWTVPSDLDCNETGHSPTCFLPRPSYTGVKPLEQLEYTLNMSLAVVPDYRFSYKYSRDYFLEQGSFADLRRALPGLDLESGMACSLASLFQLAPSAAQFEPLLFTKILPMLHRENTLVLALYIRTGFADVQATKEQTNSTAHEGIIAATNLAKKIVNCALGLEQEYLLSNNTTPHYSQVIWMVVSDSQFCKSWVNETYGHRFVDNTTFPREVVSTSSRGAHSRASRDPSTADFAEALLDWYLIGESDAVISDQIMAPSFGDTAALRTARPLYKVYGYPPVCERPRLFDAIQSAKRKKPGKRRI